MTQTLLETASRFGRDRWALALHNERALESLSLGLLFFGGGTIVLVSLLLPEAHQVDRPAAAIMAACGPPAGLVVALWGWRWPQWTIQAVLASGTLLTCGGIYEGHGAGVSASAALIFVWVSMFAFHFFSLRDALAQLLLAAAGYGVVQGVIGGPGAAAEWVMAMGTASVAGGVMWLVSRQLRQAAETDQLTGLPNRSALQRLLRVEIGRALREQTPLCIAAIDLDGFKSVNDRLGHAAGDALLTNLARAWSARLRTTDVLVRYGGDEFVIVLPGADDEEAQRAVARTMEHGEITASAGIAAFMPGDDLTSLLQRADRALYEAKARLHHALPPPLP